MGNLILCFSFCFCHSLCLYTAVFQIFRFITIFLHSQLALTAICISSICDRILQLAALHFIQYGSIVPVRVIQTLPEMTVFFSFCISFINYKSCLTSLRICISANFTSPAIKHTAHFSVGNIKNSRNIIFRKYIRETDISEDSVSAIKIIT